MRAVWLGFLDRMRDPTAGLVDLDGQKRPPLWLAGLVLGCGLVLIGPVVGYWAPAGIQALSTLPAEQQAYVLPLLSSGAAALGVWLLLRQLRQTRRYLEDCCHRGQRILASRAARGVDA